MKEAPVAEQRPHVRVPFAGPATIRSGASCINATIRDLSFSGCFIEAPLRFGVGTWMSITFSLDARETQFVTTNGRIVRRSPHGIGVRFSYIDTRTPRVINEWIASRR